MGATPPTERPDGPGADQETREAVAMMDPGGSVPRLGVWAWSFVGSWGDAVIVVVALAAVSEIVLPLMFAAVLAVIFKPLVGKLVRHGLKPTLAAGLVVLGLLAAGDRRRGRDRAGRDRADRRDQ